MRVLFEKGREKDKPPALLISCSSALALLLILLVSAPACARRSAGAAPSNDLLIVGYDREPDTLNRFSTHILEDIQTCVVEGLTTTDEQMKVVPLLASEVPTLENGGVTLRPDGGMDVVWKLRPGVKWHDGTPFTSADVKFTVDAINGPNYNPESTDGFDRIASVDTPDPLTAVVHYREIYAPYDIQFIRGMLPKHVLEGRDIDRAQDYNRNPLGTGPYRVAEWKAGEYILLERVPHYWRGAEYPHIRRLMFRFVANTNTRINQLKSGEVHVVATRAVGQVPRDLRDAVDRRPQDTRQRLRARDAERAAVAGVCRRAGAARAARTRSIASSTRAPSSTALRRWRTGRFNRSRGRIPTASRAMGSIPRRQSACSTRRAGGPARTASGSGMASRSPSR